MGDRFENSAIDWPYVRTMEPKLDKEVTAIRAVATVFDSLDTDSRRRIAKWLKDKYEEFEDD